jgi:tyrosine-protein kinase Etk/Wzc
MGKVRTVRPKNIKKNEERTLLEGILYYFGIIWRYKWIIIIITFLAAAGSVAFSIVSLRLPPEESPLPNVYQADARLLVHSGQRGGSAAILSSLGFDAPSSSGNIDMGEFAVQVLQSRYVLDQLAEEFNIVEKYEITENVRSNSRRAVLGGLSTDYNTRTGILSISYQDIDPEFAMKIVNSIVIHLQEWFVEQGGTDNLQQVKTLEEKLMEVEEDIIKLESSIQQFQRQIGALSVTEVAETQSAMLSGLQQQLMELDVRIKNYRETTTFEDDPTLQRLEAERDNIAETIAEVYRGNIGAGQPLPARNELPELQIEFSRYLRDLEVRERVFEALSEQYEVAKLTAESEPVFSVLEWAELPEEKAGPSRGRLCMIVIAVGLLAGIVIAFMINLIRNIKADPAKRTIIKENMK